MHSKNITLSVVAIGVFLAELAAAATSDGKVVEEVVQRMVETPIPSTPLLSRDGRWVAYTVATGSLQANNVVSQLVVQSVSAQSGMPQEPMVVAQAKDLRNSVDFSASWVPGKDVLSYLPVEGGAAEAGSTLALFEVATRTTTKVRLQNVRGRDGRSGTESSQSMPGRIPRDYVWTPSGEALIFQGTSRPGTPPAVPVVGVVVSDEMWDADLKWPGGTPSRSGLFRLEVSTGKMESLTGDKYDVGEFTLSSDGTWIDFTARAEGSKGSEQWELHELSLGTKAFRRICPAASTGLYYTKISVSPDGRWLVSRRLADTAYRGELDDEMVAIERATGQVREFKSASGERPYGQAVWKSDSSGFVFWPAHHMGHPAWLGKLADGTLQELSFKKGWDDTDHHVSDDGRWVAFVRSSPGVAPEVMIGPFPTGVERALTNFSERRILRSQLRTELVSWPSTDGRYTIHGFVISRDAEEPGGKLNRKPRPMLVFNMGGPGMVRPSFQLIGYPEAVVLADHGYLVLVPNTRGRNGYGMKFDFASREYGHFAGALMDLQAGVDMMVEKGIADPSRIGILGQSYGASLTSYAITMSDRFRAAVNRESAQVALIFPQHLAMLKGTRAQHYYGIMQGVTDSLEKTQKERLMADSVALHPEKVKTPVLMLFGAHSYGQKSVLGFKAMYGGLRWAGVPTELVLYDEGHVFQRPSARVDYVNRIVAWFDYWLLDTPYPDAQKMKEYDRWKRDSSRSGGPNPQSNGRN